MSKMGVVVAAMLALCAAGAAHGEIVFMDDFEDAPLVGSGNPPGWTVFGAPLLDRGTFTGQSHSPSASVWVAVSWQSWGFGATTDAAGPYDVENDSSWLSVWMRANSDLTAPSIALTIYDSDGTQWRTADADLFQATTTWTEFRTPLSNMVMEAAGTVSGLDYENVTSFGFLAFTAGQSGENTIQFDDFGVQTIPEASTVGALGIGSMMLFLLRTRGKKRAS